MRRKNNSSNHAQNLQQDLGNWRVSYALDKVSCCHHPEERRHNQMRELPHNQPHLSRKQDHSRDYQKPDEEHDRSANGGRTSRV